MKIFKATVELSTEAHHAISRASILALLPQTGIKAKIARPVYRPRRNFLRFRVRRSSLHSDFISCQTMKRTPLSGPIIGKDTWEDIFTHTEDFEYRKKYAYFRNSLYIDQAGGGPFKGIDIIAKQLFSITVVSQNYIEIQLI